MARASCCLLICRPRMPPLCEMAPMTSGPLNMLRWTIAWFLTTAMSQINRSFSKNALWIQSLFSPRAMPHPPTSWTHWIVMSLSNLSVDLLMALPLQASCQDAHSVTTMAMHSQTCKQPARTSVCWALANSGSMKTYPLLVSLLSTTPKELTAPLHGPSVVLLLRPTSW